jgi:hypothetical protein
VPPDRIGGLRPCRAGSPPPSAWIPAALIGIAVLLATLPVSFVTGSSAFWRATGPDGIDCIAALSGLRFFLSAPWTFPLLWIPGYGPGAGSSAVYADCIPFVALAMKAAGADFNPYGWWIAVAYIATPVAATRLGWLFGVRDGVSVVSLAAMAACLPAFQLRMTMPSLEMASAFVLFAAETCVRRERGEPRPWSEFLLVPAAIFVHPYVLAFVMALLVPAVASSLVRRPWRPAARMVSVLPVLAGAAAATAIAVAFGVRVPAVTGDLDWGRYSMNLLSPIWPRFSWFFPVHADSIWDLGQVDGRAWPGLGVLILASAAACANPRALVGAAVRYRALAVTALACTAYAATTRASFGPWQILYWYPVHMAWLVETFRASGRFAWVPAWLALVASAVAVRSLRHGRWLLAALAILQVIDTAGVRQEVARMASEGHAPAADAAAIRAAYLASSRVELYPPYDCVRTAREQEVSLDLIEVASETRTSVDSARLARRTVDCAAADRAASVQRSLPGTLRLFVSVPGAGRPLPSWTTACRAVPANGGVEIRACTTAAPHPSHGPHP